MLLDIDSYSIILRNVAYCCYGPFFPDFSCFLASFVFRGSIRRYMKSPKVVHVVMPHRDVCPGGAGLHVMYPSMSCA